MALLLPSSGKTTDMLAFKLKEDMRTLGVVGLTKFCVVFV